MIRKTVMLREDQVERLEMIVQRWRDQRIDLSISTIIRMILDDLDTNPDQTRKIEGGVR